MAVEKADGRGPSQVIEGSIRGMSHVDNMYPRYHGLGRALHLCGHPPPSPYPCLIVRKPSDQSQLWGILPDRPKRLTVKVTTKESPRTQHSPEELRRSSTEVQCGILDGVLAQRADRRYKGRKPGTDKPAP